jgi:hypothetical protein
MVSTPRLRVLMCGLQTRSAGKRDARSNDESKRSSPRRAACGEGGRSGAAAVLGVDVKLSQALAEPGGDGYIPVTYLPS